MVAERSATPLAEPERFANGDMNRTVNLFNAAEHDPTAENACAHLLSAWQLQTTVGSTPLERSILQHYVLCVEAVVNGTMTKIRKDRRDEIRIKESDFANGFANSLPQRADKPEAIRQASTKLREISLSNMIPSIETVSTLLQITDETKEQAKALYPFRSSSLSHPGRARSGNLEKWLKKGPRVAEICLADAVARAFFMGYCQHIHSRLNFKLS